MRYVKGHFVLTGLDVPSMRFKSRPEARDWCRAPYLVVAELYEVALKRWPTARIQMRQEATLLNHKRLTGFNMFSDRHLVLLSQKAAAD